MRSRSGFDEFVAAHAAALLRAAWLLTGNLHDAEDLVQETLTRLYVHWPRVRAAEHQLAYARTSLVRCHISRRRVRRASETPVDELPESVAPQTDPDTRLMLSQALARLSPIDRAVLVLRYYEGRTAPEVAATLRISAGAVRKRAARALAEVRTHLPTDDSDLVTRSGGEHDRP